MASARVKLVACLASCLLAAGCSGDSVAADTPDGSISGVKPSTTATSPQHDASADEIFWAALRINGDEVEGFSSLEELGSSADIVVTARIRSYGQSLEIQGDAEEDVVVYASAQLDVETVWKGEIPADLAVEFLVVPNSQSVRETIETQSENLPTSDALWFLREKAGSEAGHYRLVNSTGIWVTHDDQGLRAPLAELIAPVEGDGEHEHEPEQLPYGLESGLTLDQVGERATG